MKLPTAGRDLSETQQETLFLGLFRWALRKLQHYPRSSKSITFIHQLITRKLTDSQSVLDGGNHDPPLYAHTPRLGLIRNLARTR